MNHPLDNLLDFYRTHAISERDKGTAFEKLIAAWLVIDPVQVKRFAQVELWSDWADRQKQDRSDVGIDLVATCHDGSLVAVQCKFFDADRRIRKDDIDSFISASAKHTFAGRVIVETTDVPWSDKAGAMLHGQRIPTVRIGLRDLRESKVNWPVIGGEGNIVRSDPKKLRPDQTEAIEAVQAGLRDADRGKLIMACGTGKTLIGLRIAEKRVGQGGHVLLLVPSLALMAQTVREWCVDSDESVPLTAFAVCSDKQVGRRRRSQNDVAELEVTDLAFPATTDAAELSQKVAESDAGSMRVVFATYQSISVIAAGQAHHGLPEFDLIVCDEAHRTTGVTFAGEDQSEFVKVHDNELIRGRKRIYMTATPRIYGENAKSRARDTKAVLSSMDDPELYGEVLFYHGFARAVESNILTDYRVIVLAMDEGKVSAAVQKRLADKNSELQLDDVTKIVGCWKALSKIGIELGRSDDHSPMRRALAFCRSIASSKVIRDEFEKVVSEFLSLLPKESQQGAFCEIRHVDGTQKARERGKNLDWLKEDAGENVCRILSNARCLTEGVDVPALDAILFLNPRKSQIDVVQAVGRVMRKAAGKKMGYVILPVGIPPGVPADIALGNNKKYRVVWQILNALRAHDERLDAVINQGGLGQNVSDRILIVDGRELGESSEIQSVTATVEKLPERSSGGGPDIIGSGSGGTDSKGDDDSGSGGGGESGDGAVVIDDFTRAVMAKIVEKCGTRDYWEDWAKDVAEIAERHVTRITSLIEQPDTDARSFFQDFLRELRDDLNESITERDAIEMLAQHLITRPVFGALFQEHAFIDQNPVSAAMTEILSVIDEAQVDREGKTLEGFYASVRRRAEGITDPVARQNLIVELYEKFFKEAFPRTTKMLGIVYTPVEVVDFIIRSVNDVLEDEFGQTIGSKGVHILDPFAGTGTFITRLLQSGLISPEDLERKYRTEIHANEIVLLAYYIAAINIESVLHSVTERKEYLPYEGICLTDTFALHERDDELSFYMKDNTDRRERQKETDIQVIIGNPPYSVGQRSENDNEKNVDYTKLDERIQSTYARRSNASNLRNLYDSYIRAIRWGSDRLGKAGVMAFVSGSAWVERSFADGMRRCLHEDFSSIHVFHLRGDIRKNMLSGSRAGEGGNIFGQGSMTGIAITVLVKNPDASEQGRILFHDIGDNLDQTQKLNIIRTLGSIRGINKADGWSVIQPDEYGDWLDQRDQSFEKYPKIGDKKSKTGNVLFQNYSLGVITKRDVWCINPSREALTENVERTIQFYNSEVIRWLENKKVTESREEYDLEIDDFVNTDPMKIKWSPYLKAILRRGKKLAVEDGQFLPCMYRPFTKQWQFFSRRLNEMVNFMPSIFPNANLANRVIILTGKGGRSGFSILMVGSLLNHHTIDSGQCFPFWFYPESETGESAAPKMFSENGTAQRRRHAITDYAVEYFRKAYPSESVSREDTFHYIYGLLHSEDYRSRFRANLTKELPRIPCVKSTEDYRAFRDAGQYLGELHIGYEEVDLYPATIDTDGKLLMDDPEKVYRVTKMKHPRSGKNKDKSTIIYNSHITVRNIPEEAWGYVLNGKAALEWVMDRQCVKTDKKSGIVSDANCYAIETVGNPRYPLDLLLRMITVSLETVKTVQNLPELVID